MLLFAILLFSCGDSWPLCWFLLCFFLLPFSSVFLTLSLSFRSVVSLYLRSTATTFGRGYASRSCIHTEAVACEHVSSDLRHYLVVHSLLFTFVIAAPSSSPRPFFPLVHIICAPFQSLLSPLLTILLGQILSRCELLNGEYVATGDTGGICKTVNLLREMIWTLLYTHSDPETCQTDTAVRSCNG